MRITPNHRLHVGLFTDSYPPIVNGVSVAIANHHEQLLKQGVDSHVFTIGYEDYHDRHVYRTPGVPLGSTPFRTNIRLNRRSYHIAHLLDVFHIHDPFNIAWHAIPMAEKLRRPIIFTNHTRHDIYLRNFPRVTQPALEPFVYFRLVQVIKASTLVTAPSYETANWLKSLVPESAERLRVIHNGIPLHKFQKLKQHIARTELGIPDDQVVLIYVGRLTPEKNLEALASGFIQAVKNGAQVHWLVIGDGTLRTRLEEQVACVQDRVHFIGQVAPEQIPGFLNLADVFVTTSLSEVNPLSVIEAMACGKPLIGYKGQWWNEFPERHRYSLLTEHNEHALGLAIQRLSENRQLRATMSVAAKQISSHFDIQFTTDQWLEAYQLAMDNAYSLALKPKFSMPRLNDFWFRS